MPNEIVRADPPHPGPTLPALPGVDVLSAWLAGRKRTTVEAYQFDLNDFRKSLGMPTAAAAVELLLAQPPGGANALVLGYRADMQARGLATATIARRLAALRSVVRIARMLGRVAWDIDVEAPRVERRRDVRGPSRDGWRRLWHAAKGAGDAPKARRDRAMIALMFDLGLRRGEVVSLDVASLDLAEGTVGVVGKGHVEAQRLTLPAPTVRALAEWLEARGPEPGPLFIRCDPGAVGRGRLTGASVCRMVKALGVAAELPRAVRPHGLRHASITAALDLGRDVREVRKFSRHKKLETVLLYDDDRRDVAGDIASQVAGGRE